LNPECTQLRNILARAAGNRPFSTRNVMILARNNFPGAHSQGETLDELRVNLREVIAMLLEDGEPLLEAEFVGTQNLAFA